VKQIQLIVNGVKLHPRFNVMALDALDRLKAAPALPPLSRRHVHFQASDGSLHDIPRKQLAQARQIDPVPP